MHDKTEFDRELKDIRDSLNKLESRIWEVYVDQIHPPGDPERDDHIAWFFYGTRQLYYQICVYLELRGLKTYLEMFRDRFAKAVADKKEYDRNEGFWKMEVRYSEFEPSMIILDEFREFLLAFPDTRYPENKQSTDTLRSILENTHGILSRTSTAAKNETAVYNVVKWFIDVVYPSTRSGGKTRFQKKFTNYKPDILIPEIQSAVEYKYVRSGKSSGIYLDQLKTDADCYTGDPEFKYFYAVVFYEDKGELNPQSFRHGVMEKGFPENWTVIAI